MKTIFFFSVFFLSGFVFGQRQLEYNQSLIITDALVTVPTDKVWKVTAVYGEEFFLSECVSNQDPNDDWLGLKCQPVFVSGSRSISLSYFATLFSINGTRIPVKLSGIPSGNTTWYTSSTNCTGSTNNSYAFGCANKSTNVNLLPMWLPAGSTVQTGGPNTFLSVIEFNILN